MPRSHTLLAALLALVIGPVVLAAPAGAHAGGSADERAKKRQQFTDGVNVPVVSSPNIRFVENFPETAAISGIFAKGAPYFYVSSTDSISVFDVSDPVHPTLTGTLPNLVFENEAMNYGEKKVDGVVNRFVLVGADLVEYGPTEPDHLGRSNEVMVVDVTDPTRPYIRSRVATRTNTHTVSCIDESDCQYAYTAGGNGTFSVVDLTDLDAPRELGVFGSPAGDPNAVFTRGAGHKWNFDDAGYGVHTGSGGSAIFDVSDPTDPVLAATTDRNGTRGPWNDFIHHNSARPNASRFASGTAPSVAAGNVLLVTEEDYENTDCATAGSFQTWHVGRLDGTPGSIRPLDRINPVDIGEGVSAPHLAFCSAHWFDYHQSGIVAQGYYEGGLRLIDTRDPSDLKEYGYVASGLSEVWDAYWVPSRNSHGGATGRKTNVVYTVDAVRGLDVYTVDLPGSGGATSQPLLGSLGGADGPAAAVIALLVAGLAPLGIARRRRLADPAR
ncbi:MAG: LVIVD repeat-containing protein [Actinomycetes bacterium]